MNHPVPPRAFQKVDKATFYEFVEKHEGRFEYEDGYIVEQMNGGTIKHFLVAKSFAHAFDGQLDTDRWLVLSGPAVDMSDSARFPAVVVMSASEPLTSQFTRRPALVVEVVSPSSRSRDLLRKPQEYLRIDTLQAYFVASQDEMSVVAWVRSADGAFRDEAEVMSGPEARIVVPQLEINLALADVYRGIDLSPRQSEED